MPAKRFASTNLLTFSLNSHRLIVCRKGLPICVAVFQLARLGIALGHRPHNGIVVRRNVLGRQHLIQQNMPIPLILRNLLVGDWILGIQNYAPALTATSVFSVPSVPLW